MCIYRFIYSLLQNECDELLHAAKVGDINVISIKINDGVDMNVVVNKVDTNVHIQTHICTRNFQTVCVIVVTKAAIIASTIDVMWL